MRVKIDKDPEYLSTLERGLRVLGVFSRQAPELTLGEVATAADLSPAVARRCLNTLVALGYVAQSGRRFVLRPKVLEFGDAYLSSANVEQAVTPYLQSLRDETGDSASMAVRAGSDAMYIAHVSTQRQIRLAAHPGTRFPLHATSLGKALLAFGSTDELENYLKDTPRESFTANTIVTAVALREEMETIRRLGYATAADELDFGITSIAVPIFSADKEILAAINCSTSTARAARENFVETRLPLIKEAAAHIERSVRNFPTLIQSLRLR